MKKVIFLLGALLSLNAAAQIPQNNLKIDCILKTEGDKVLSNTSVLIKTEGGDVLDSITTNATGRIEYYINFDQVCDLWFQTSNYQTKIIRFDTRKVPKNEQKWGYEYGGFTVKLVSGTDTSKPKPSIIIKYDKSLENFNWERVE